MSVINQMLRDLDQRGQPLDASPTGAPLQAGTHSVAAQTAVEPARAPRWRGWFAAVLGIAGLGAGAAWFAGLGPFTGGGTSAVAVTGSAPMPLPVAASVPQLPPSGPAPVMADSAPPDTTVAKKIVTFAARDFQVSLRVDSQLQRLPTASAPTAAAGTTVPASPLPASASPRLATQPKAPAAPIRAEPAPGSSRPVEATAASAVAVPASVPKSDKLPVAAPVPASPAAAASADAAGSSAQRQVAAARDALAQAQSLWNNGNASAAQDLLRDALQVALRSAVTGMDSVLVAMVRELARMQLASGHVAEAHELLIQQEPRIKGSAELWAMRGNAAQRLGQHQDSVHAYMQALQSRPTEQRWLLGLAVSLAAMGQTATAGEITEKARAEGPIPRDIAAYLRQMGVVVK